MTVRIHIHELVLHGVDPGDRRAIGDAVTTEIRDALRLRRHTEPRSIDRLDAGTLHVRPRSGMRGLGGRIARTLEGALR